MRGQGRECKGTHLLIDCIPVAEYKPTTNETGYEGIPRSFFASICDFALHEEDSLVYRDELGQVESMLFRSFVYESSSIFQSVCVDML